VNLGGDGGDYGFASGTVGFSRAKRSGGMRQREEANNGNIPGAPRTLGPTTDTRSMAHRMATTVIATTQVVH
jgi:hypothetical protein